MSNADLFRAYLCHYADRNLEAISDMLADQVHLRDWNISVRGKPEVLRETATNFAESESIEIEILALYQSTDTVAGEIRIVVNGTIELHAVDIVSFDSRGLVTAIRSYKGRGD
jgi:steroid delta-isomerase